MRIVAALATAALAIGPVAAQPPAPAPNAGPVIPPASPRGRAPKLDAAVEMARTAIATCKANGYDVTALVTDATGMTVAMLTGDATQMRTQVIAPTKVAMVLQYREPSGVTTARAKSDAALAAALASNPKVGVPRQGALPIMVGSEMIGVVSVSGAPGGDKDEVCARAGLDKVRAQLG